MEREEHKIGSPDKTKLERASDTAERLYQDLELCETICSDKSWRRIADTILAQECSIAK